MEKIIIYILLFLVVDGYTQDRIVRTENDIETLLSEMTLEEKIGQMTLYTSSWTQTGPTLRDSYLEDVKAGRCGNIFNAHTAEYTRELQRMAVEDTRLGIPLLFGYDVIHGYKTIFPIPLAEACSWDLPLIEESARLASKEAAAAGLHWTFNPMVDLSRDPRWGRVAEASGEDPYLGSLIAAAKVKGHQGADLSDTSTLLACVKHFAAYGAAQAGRDYHTVDMSERVLRETYLPPYKAALDAGCATVMTAFNELDGVPASANTFLLNDILRKEWGFEGFVVTDYTSINEMVPHGFAIDEKHAGELAVNAGVDMDMQGAVFQTYLNALVTEGKVKESDIDNAVKKILLLKLKLGLFEDPYKYADVEREKATVHSKELMDHARDIAAKSIVLLKNDSFNNRPLLPLSRAAKNIALIGPLADNQEDLLGTWHASGENAQVVPLRAALESRLPEANIIYEAGCTMSTDDTSGFAASIRAAEDADIILMAVGENYRQSGEAASRSILDLPGAQEELIKEIHARGKPIVMILMAGRPLCIPWFSENIPAILNTWHLGSQAGEAIVDVLLGAYNPSGKLVMSFPRNEGQIPIYYSMKNTGRPFSAENKYTSKYLDVVNEPLYPFGFGLSYTEFSYHNLQINKTEFSFDEEILISVDVSNTGKLAGEEVVQLYIQDVVGSVTRPVKELKGFKKISLEPSERKEIQFELTSDDLRFYTQDMDFEAEAGQFKVFVGGNSVDVLEINFILKSE